MCKPPAPARKLRIPFPHVHDILRFYKKEGKRIHDLGKDIMPTSVADPAMGGPGGRPPPIDQNLGLVRAAPLRHGANFHLSP